MNVESIRKFCLSLPKATEDLKWGSELCFCIGKKMFCMMGTAAGFSVLFKCSQEDFDQLCERDGVNPAPYLARNKWVQVQKETALSTKEWRSYMETSYKMICEGLPKKTRMELGLIN
jgi:predicted DNA-binding protein (MmcQ/YjbR family)